MKDQKLYNLEGLRGVAATAVAFYHFEIGSHLNNSFVHGAWLMVDFFFVLSGFIISLKYSGKISTKYQLYVFYVKRFLRLYPLHILTLFVFFGFESIKYFAETQYGFVSGRNSFSSNDAKAFIANILLIHNWIMPKSTFNGPSWSISSEFFVYGIFAILAYVTQFSRILFLSVAFALVIISLTFLHDIGMWASSGPVRCIYSFFIGVLIQQIHAKTCDRFIHFHTSLAGASLVIASVIMVILYGDTRYGVSIFIPVLFGITIFVLASTNNTSIVNRLLGSNVLVYLGTISYGIYMIHSAVWYLWGIGLRYVFKLPVNRHPGGRSGVVVENIFVADLILLSGFAVIIALSHLSCQYMEKRFNAIGKNMHK